MSLQIGSCIKAEVEYGTHPEEPDISASLKAFACFVNHWLARQMACQTGVSFYTRYCGPDS